MKILLIRLSSLGDIILTTPAIRALREKYPDCQIDFVLYDHYATALEYHPEIARLVRLPKKRLKALLAQREYARFRQLFSSFISDLRAETYDYVVDLHNVTDSALVALLARGTIKVGHKKQLLSCFFNVRSRFDVGFASATLHAAAANMQFLVDANCLTQADLPGKPHLEFFVPPEISGEVDCYLAGSGLDKGTLIGINPCASYDYKRWSARRFAAVADYLVDTCGARILLFGSPSERPVVQQVMAAMRHPATDTSHLSLYQAFELIRRLRLFVTNDSAPMHIAAALGTPLVALHGPINVKKFAPLTDVGRGISIDLPCRPCKEIARCESRLCFDNVTVDDVCRVCDEVLTLSARVHS